MGIGPINRGGFNPYFNQRPQNTLTEDQTVKLQELIKEEFGKILDINSPEFKQCAIQAGQFKVMLDENDRELREQYIRLIREKNILGK